MDSALAGALGSQLVDAIFPNAGSTVGGWLGAEGDTGTSIGNALIGAGLGALSGGGARGALAGGLGSYATHGGGTQLGSLLGLKGTTGRLIGDALLGAGAGSMSGAGAGKGALSGSALALLSKDGSTPNLFKMSTPAHPDGGLQEVHPTATRVDENGNPVSQPAVDSSQPGGLQGGLDAVMKYIHDHPTLSAALLMALTTQGKQPYEAKPFTLPPNFTQTATAINTPTFNRRVNPLGHYYTYGQAPEPAWMGSGNSTPSLPANYADGGEVGYSHGGSGLDALGHVQGPGDGRDDFIPAKLSNDEYVMDAETVALLGNGSPAAGAKKLDKLRAKIRSHKGKSLAKGKISPDAHDDVESYLKGGST